MGVLSVKNLANLLVGCRGHGYNAVPQLLLGGDVAVVLEMTLIERRIRRSVDGAGGMARLLERQKTAQIDKGSVPAVGDVAQASDASSLDCCE